MAVLRIEKYGNILKVILKPTKNFPEGYFYTDDNAVTRELIKNYSWYLSKHNNNVYVKSSSTDYDKHKLFFHQEYAYRILGYYPTYIDHINRVEIDNRDINLNIINQQQNMRNQPTKGFIFNAKLGFFQPFCMLDGKYVKGSNYKTEPEVLIATFYLRQEIFKDYNYNFFLDRKGHEDILDRELTGKITIQSAMGVHIKRYVESNPWYTYRYNLFDYCRQYNIQIPSFSLDSEGFMIDSTGKRLCPYR